MRIKPALLALALALPSILAAQAADGSIIGQASVIDGDTIEIRGQRIRLWGIDAPESDQLCQMPDGTPWRCGQQAANALANVIGRRNVSCMPVGQRSYNREVARCQVGGIDLGHWLVAGGWALDMPRFSGHHYRNAERTAQHTRAGIHQGSFSTPTDHRSSKRRR